MKLDTFNRLPLDQKTSYMWDHGICFAQRIIENRYILCILRSTAFLSKPSTHAATTASMPFSPLPTFQNGKAM